MCLKPGIKTITDYVCFKPSLKHHKIKEGIVPVVKGRIADNLKKAFEANGSTDKRFVKFVRTKHLSKMIHTLD